MQLEGPDHYEIERVCSNLGRKLPLPFQYFPMAHLRNGCCGGVAGVVAWISVHQARGIVGPERAHPIVDVVVLPA